MRYQLKIENIQIVEDASVCTKLACSAAMCRQEEEEKQRKRRKICTRKFLLNHNKYGAYVITVNALRENEQ